MNNNFTILLFILMKIELNKFYYVYNQMLLNLRFKEELKSKFKLLKKKSLIFKMRNKTIYKYQ